VLPSGPRGPRGGALNWGSGFLATRYQGVPFQSGGDPILDPSSPAGFTDSRQGQTIDVCLADTGYSYTEIPITAYHGAGIEPHRGESTAPPSGTYPCRDGWVLISAGDQHHWHRVCNALGKPEWLEDPRFTTRHERANNAQVVTDAMKALLANMTMKEAIAHFTHHDVTAAPVNTIAQAAQDPHPWERRAMVEVPDFLAGSIAVDCEGLFGCGDGRAIA